MDGIEELCQVLESHHVRLWQSLGQVASAGRALSFLGIPCDMPNFCAEEIRSDWGLTVSETINSLLATQDSVTIAPVTTA
jgi:hypothetical protein